MDSAKNKIEARISAFENRLSVKDRALIASHTHLDCETPERAYWHFGYVAALRDILKLFDTPRLFS